LRGPARDGRRLHRHARGPARPRDRDERRRRVRGRRRRRPDLSSGRDVGGLGLHGRARRRALPDRRLTRRRIDVTRAAAREPATLLATGADALLRLSAEPLSLLPPRSAKLPRLVAPVVLAVAWVRW